jgi:hypothetical protein
MDSPRGFKKRGFDSNFVLNCSDYVMGFVFLFLIYVFIILLVKILRKRFDENNKILKIVLIIKENFEWGAFIGTLEASYLSFVTFSFLQLLNSSVD